MKTYFKITCKNLPAAREDIFTEKMFSMGASGIYEKLDFDVIAKDFQPIIHDKPIKDVEVYFESLPPADIIPQIQYDFPEVQVLIAEEEYQDWLKEWKKGYKPFCLVEPYWVVPTWLETPKEATKIIRIDPGMAFGTGTHATTQVASQITFDVTRRRASENPTVADIGTGTGILAMLAKFEGASQVVGTEIDEVAAEVARENVELNGLKDIEIFYKELSQLKGEYDIVIANIIDGVLLDLKVDLLRLLKKQGSLILSGILQERYDNFITEFLKGTELKIKTKLQKDEWMGILLEE